jgi:hypothetical protein
MQIGVSHPDLNQPQVFKKWTLFKARMPPHATARG